MSHQLVELVKKEFGSAILETRQDRGDESVRVAPDDLVSVLGHLKRQGRCEMLVDVVGVDFPERAERFQVNYLLRSLEAQQRITVSVDVGEGAEIESAAGLYRSADWHEREVYDLYGVRFRNHPNLRRILCHEEFEGHALRKDYPIEQGQPLSEPARLIGDADLQEATTRAAQLAGDSAEEVHPSDLLTVNIGPSHPATHGALRCEVLCDGETIVKAVSEIGYLHRCFEKEAEDHTWQAVMPYTDRLNYCSSMLNNVIYAGAVEKMLGIEVTPRCKAIRVIVSELSRIIDHAVCVCANLVDVGALTNYWYLYNIREGIYYDIIEPLCGSRLTTNYARIGGLSHDLFDGFAEAVEKHLQVMEESIGEVLGLIARNRIFLDRTVGVGAISREDALSFGFTGPCLRATGVDYDVRKYAPYLGYEDYDFDIPVGEGGDTQDRINVRLAEMGQSARIIRQALQKLPDGPIMVDDPRFVLPPKQQVYKSIEGTMNQFKLVSEGIQVPAGAAYGFGEGANGELGFYCVSDGTGKPWRLKVRPPCFPIFGAFEHIITGGMIPDAIATLGSLNIIAGELDR